MLTDEQTVEKIDYQIYNFEDHRLVKCVVDALNLALSFCFNSQSISRMLLERFEWETDQLPDDMTYKWLPVSRPIEKIPVLFHSTGPQESSEEPRQDFPLDWLDVGQDAL